MPRLLCSMDEAIHSKTESRAARQSGGATSDHPSRGGWIRAGAIHGVYPAPSGFLFRLAILQRNCASARGFRRAGVGLDQPQLGVAFP